ncbi:MAG: hypothetical protein DLD55_04440 [candidate division SR1 bacterium]|nr:MAG: hypothetical protein DLD55_04440 [candidate division SR1 bacterium]
MKREDMSREEIELLAPHLRVIAEDAKKEAVLKQSGYKGDTELPSRVQAVFAIVMLICIVLGIWFIVAF